MMEYVTRKFCSALMVKLIIHKMHYFGISNIKLDFWTNTELKDDYIREKKSKKCQDFVIIKSIDLSEPVASLSTVAGESLF